MKRRKMLHTLARRNRWRDLDEVLDAGTGVDARDARERTALMVAVENGNTRFAREILRRGADPNLPDSTGTHPLHVAIRFRPTELVRDLLLANARPDIPDGQGYFPLYYAAQRSDTQVLDLLVSHGVTDLEARSPNDETALGFAAAWDRSRIAAWLLAHGADPNTCENVPVLSDAVQQGSVEVVSLLLSHGADPDLAPHGVTPLMYAAELGSASMVRRLLQAGADPHAIDPEGLQARDRVIPYLERGAEAILQARAEEALAAVPRQRAGVASKVRVRRTSRHGETMLLVRVGPWTMFKFEHHGEVMQLLQDHP